MLGHTLMAGSEQSHLGVIDDAFEQHNPTDMADVTDEARLEVLPPCTRILPRGPETNCQMT